MLFHSWFQPLYTCEQSGGKRQTIVAKGVKNAGLPQWFAAITRKKARHVSFSTKKYQFSHGKALLPK